MAHDQFPEEMQTTRPGSSGGGGGSRLMLAGVVGACVLGVGFGLWARPSSLERGDAPPPPKPEIEAEASDRKLEIVLDDTPAPIGQLLDVMPADMIGRHPAAPAPELMAPKGPPAGLIKADAPIPAMTAPPVEVLPLVLPKPAPIPAKVEKAKVETKAEPKPDKPKPAARVAEAKPKPVAKAEKPKSEEPKSRAKPERETKVAKAEPKPKAEAKAKVRKADEPKKLAKLTKAVKAAPKAIKAKAAEAERKTKREIQLAEAKLVKAKKAQALKAQKAQKAQKAADARAAERRLAEKKAAQKKIQLAQAQKAAKLKAKPAVEKASTPRKKAVVPRGEGPMRVARNDARPNPCAAADPGEALVCADPRLNQRDRQLQRAFRNAEAAGVPASALQRQQERWRQARSAAARDGSWAVEDVYEARIAELNDLARDARDY